MSALALEYETGWRAGVVAGRIQEADVEETPDAVMHHAWDTRMSPDPRFKWMPVELPAQVNGYQAGPSPYESLDGLDMSEEEEYDYEGIEVVPWQW